jgi:hypothetical protein
MEATNSEKIPFERYFDELDKESKRIFLSKVLVYISASYFYACVRGTFKFSILMQEKIEQITNQQFNWNDQI